MKLDGSNERRGFLPACLVWGCLLGGAFAIGALADEVRADPLNPFRTFTDSGVVSPEERARRDQVRTELYDRYSADYQMTVPFVSEASITALQQAIERYQRIVQAGGWPAVGDKVTLRPGDTGAEIATIRQHLMIEGDLPDNSGRSPTFDDEFLAGLARFQVRNGLRVSGFVDSRTLAALNVSASERLQQLKTNLARIQGLMKINKAPRYVLVNVPAFMVQGVEKGSLAISSNVITGKPARPTPAVSASIVEINFFPTWTVPEIVAQQDLIPKIRKDPSYFSEEHFTVRADWKAEPLNPATVDWNSPQVVSYKFRQEPGTFNALGVVRINMPNKYSVYMHDTPLKQLFSQSVRAFSSGCVRVEKVLDLVAWLLSDQKGWDLARVQTQVDRGERLDVKLSKPVPVHFVYLTAFATESGMVEFRQDIYGRDAPGADEADDPQNAVVAQQRSAVTP
ncbi:MAG: L,D-transpeptidase family protein [Hyphomicrobium sp.]